MKNRPADWNRQLAGLVDFARTTTVSGLSRERSTSKIQQIFRRAALINDSKLREVLSLRDRLPGIDSDANSIKCGAGCAFCCYQWVRASAVEALAVAAFIRETWSTGQIEALLSVCGEYRVVFNGIPQGVRASLRCPLLLDNRCTVYQVRPLICRGCNSMDAIACERGMEDPNGDTLIPVVMPVVEASAAIRQGFTMGIADIGLARREVVFALALETLLRDATASERFLGGEDVFAGDLVPEGS